MQLIATKGKASDKGDRLDYVRKDGTRSTIDMPRQGILPHDLVHCVVENGLGFKDGFTGRVARGASPQFADSGDLEHTRDLKIAESVVEAMQTQLACGSFDYEAFLYGVETACASREVLDVPPLNRAAAESAFARAIALNEEWRAVPPLHSFALTFDE
jgi:hypothetical protein